MLKSSRPRITKNLWGLVVGIAGLAVAVVAVQQTVRRFSRAYYPGDLSAKFREEVMFTLSSTSQLYGFFTTDHRQVTRSAQLPSSIQFQSGIVTFTDKGGIVIENPAKNEQFYRVEMTFADTGQQNLTAYLTGIDALWTYTTPTAGGSAGLDTASSLLAYWWHHTQLKTESQVTAVEWKFSNEVKNKFIRRKNGDVRVDLYVTPNGTYPVINGANFGSYPDMYIGSYTYRGGPINYLVLGKWNSGGDQVTFKSLKVVKLDANITTTDEVNAYFIKRTLNSGAFSNLFSTGFSGNGSGGMQNLLWAAFLYRGNDYYFRTNNKVKVQELFDAYLALMANEYTSALASWSPGSIGGFINHLHWTPSATWAISDYLRSDQVAAAKALYAKVADKLMAMTKTDGSFPAGVQYIGDTFGEALAWPLSYLGGYAALAPEDHPRVDKVLQYITFYGHCLISTDKDKTMEVLYGSNLNLPDLPAGYKTFKCQYAYPDGKIDNHGWHPSTNYGEGVVGLAAAVKNQLAKKGLTISPDTLSRNLTLAYNVNVADQQDIYRMRLKGYKESGYDPVAPSIAIREDERWWRVGDATNFRRNDILTWYRGWSKPSLLEDWTAAFTSYSVPENYGDSVRATNFARNVYYSYYSGAGKLFCGATPDASGNYCSAGDTNVYNYLFTNALYAMLFSPRSTFASELPRVLPTPTPNPIACSFSTRTVNYDSATGQTYDTVTRGSTWYQRGDSPGWTRNDLAMMDKYKNDANAPCYGKSPGGCRFTTRAVFYDSNGKYNDSITVGPNFYNWTDGTGWWKVASHDLASVSRYKENAHAPCYNKSSGQCVFSSRYVYYEKGTSKWFEGITAGSQLYLYASGVGWTVLSDHDLTASTYYKQNQYAPCYGKSRGTCTFDSDLRYYDKAGTLIESISAGDRFNNYTFSATGWWPIANNRLSQTPRYLENNAPCVP